MEAYRGINMNLVATLTTSQPLLLQGVFMTLRLWCVALVIALIVGCLWGVLRSRKLRITGISLILDAVTFILRGIPFYVQLLIAYFVIPGLLGIDISAFFAATISLGICSAAYISQMVRGGINAVADGQWLAAQALGYSSPQMLRFIILPQVTRIILPALTGECDQLLKSTSIISAIGVLEITRAGMNIIARQMNPLSIYTAVALLYLILSSLLNIASYFLERRLS